MQGSLNITKPEAEILGGNHKFAPPPFFLNKPSSDDEEVTDNFDTGLDNDLEAILDGFVGVISILPVEFEVPSQVEEFKFLKITHHC